MKSELLLEKIKNIPGIEKKATWFIKNYCENGKYPWDINIPKLSTELELKLPPNLDSQTKEYLVGLAILGNNIKLETGYTPGTYRINIKEIGYQDEITDVQQFCVHSVAMIIIYFHQSVQKNENANPEQSLQNRTEEWNSSRYVVQEKVKADSDKYSMKEVATLNGFREDYIPQILNDYYSRIDREKLDKLNSFLQTVENLFKENKGLVRTATFCDFIFQEVQNGGININTPEDILPHYKGLHLN